MLFRDDLKQKKVVQINVPHKKNMMCLNESTLDPFPILKEVFLRKMQKVHLNRYFNDISKSLLLKLSDYAGVRQENLVIGNGADEMLYYIFTAVRNNSKDWALSLSPSYFDYKSYTAAVGINIKFLDLDKNFDFNQDNYLELCQDDNCRLAILCNPNNPTGNLFETEKILEIVDKSKNLVLVDETYYEFSGVSLVKYIEKFPNLILVRSFSKSFSAAGLRFGYAISNKDNIKQLKKVMTAFNISLFTQTLVDTILDFKETFLEHIQKVIRKRNALFENLNKLDNIEAKPSATNFLAFTAHNKSSKLFQYLQQNEIALRDIGSHPILYNYLRVTVGTTAQNEYLLKNIEKFLRGKDENN